MQYQDNINGNSKTRDILIKNGITSDSLNEISKILTLESIGSQVHIAELYPIIDATQQLLNIIEGASVLLYTTKEK